MLLALNSCLFLLLLPACAVSFAPELALQLPYTKKAFFAAFFRFSCDLLVRHCILLLLLLLIPYNKTVSNSPHFFVETLKKYGICAEHRKCLRY